MYCTYTGRSRSVVGVGASRAVHARRESNQRSGACASPNRHAFTRGAHVRFARRRFALWQVFCETRESYNQSRS